MKYIKGYLLLGLTLILGSCSDFLDRDPDQILTNDQADSFCSEGLYHHRLP